MSTRCRSTDPCSQSILFHIVAVTDSDTVISVSIIRIFPTDFVVAAQSQGIGPGHRVGIAEYRIIAALHGIIGPQYMGKIGFRRGAAVLLLAIHAIAVADGRAFVTMGRIVDPQRSRIVSVGIVSMADGGADVLGLVVLADGHTHVISHAVFPDGYAVFLGVGLMADSHRRPTFCRHITAHGHRIGGIDKPGHHIIPVHKVPIRSIVPLPAAGDVPLFIQPVVGILLIAGQFPISIHIIAADRVQDFGLVADSRRMIPFGHIVHAHCGSSAGVIGLPGPVLAVIGGHIVVDFHRLAVVFIRAVIAPLRIFGPDIIFVIHVLARGQFIDFHLFVIIGIGIRIVDLYGNPFRIQLLIRIGFIPADGFLRFRGMGEFPHPVPSPQHHIFRFAVHPGIAGFGILLDGRDLVVLSDDQVALRIIGGVGIASLGRGLRLVFDIHRLVGRGIACIGGSCRNQRDRRESQPQGQS